MTSYRKSRRTPKHSEDLFTSNFHPPFRTLKITNFSNSPSLRLLVPSSGSICFQIVPAWCQLHCFAFPVLAHALRAWSAGLFPHRERLLLEQPVRRAIAHIAPVPQLLHWWLSTTFSYPLPVQRQNPFEGIPSMTSGQFRHAHARVVNSSFQHMVTISFYKIVKFLVGEMGFEPTLSGF